MAAQSQGSRTIRFWVVSIGVKFYTVRPSKKTQSSFVHQETGERIRHTKTVSEGAVAREDVARSFPTSSGAGVIASREEVEMIVSSKRGELEIAHLIPAAEVPFHLEENSYYLVPEKRFERPFAIFREALRQRDAAAVTKFLGKTGYNQALAFIQPYGDTLLLHVVRYPNEQYSPPEVPVVSFTDEEMKLMLELVDRSTVTFDPAAYHDTLREEVRAFIDAKAAGQEPVLAKAEPEPVVNLMEVLRESVERTGKAKAAKKPPKKMAGAARKREKKAAPKKKGA